MDYYRENGDIRRIHARDTGSLSKGFRSPFLELFPALEPYGNAFVIIKPIRNPGILVLFRPLGGNLLLTDVPFVLSHNTYLFHNRPRQD